MVKCSPCMLAADVRYTKPSGVCEECTVITPYGDRLCSSCSDAHQRCQCCRSKRVQALISIPADTAPLVEALAAAQIQQQQQQQLSPRSLATTARGSPHSRSAATSAHGSPIVSARGTSLLATSPFHFANATTYTLPDDESFTATAPAGTLPLGASGHHDSSAHSLALVPMQSSALVTHRDQMLAAAPATSGSVILSPSGKLVPSTLTPLSPRMAVKQNARGIAPQIRDAHDAYTLVESWTKPELVSTIYHYYCNHKASKISVQLALGKFRHFAQDAGLIGPADPALGASSLSSNRLDILFTQCTRPLSGQRSHMTEDQFFEALGSLALWRYGGGSGAIGTATGATQQSKLAHCLEKLFALNLSPLASEIVQSRRGGVYLRGEEFEPAVSAALLRYEEPLRKIFVRLARAHYSDAPRADETLSHPLVEEGWKAFCRSYDFFPTNVSVSSVLKLFVASATGLVRQGQQERAAMSFDDFMHGLFQLAQLAFTLTPNARPLERVQLLLSKIDQRARELAFTPAPQRPSDEMRDAPPQRMLAPTDHTPAEQELIPYKGEHELQASGGGAYESLYNLFSPGQLACTRDLFNLYCNSAAAASYSEILPRVAWVKLVREARLVDGRTFTQADGDIIFNSVLAASHQAAHTAATAFAHGRVMVFPLFLRGLLEVASRKHASRPTTVALERVFADHFEPLLAHKVEQLKHAQRAIELPLGAGLNGSGSAAASPGTWGVRDPWLEQQQPAGPLYPNHPAHTSPIDVDAVLASDLDVASVFASYAKVLSAAFFRASWDGVEAQHGASIPRVGSASLLHNAPNLATQHQASWDHFLQAKSLLSEHAFRRWLSLLRVVPELVAHKQVTLLMREGNVGFDRTQNQFVLNQAEFHATLLRIALLAFSGSGYAAAYPSPASKLELLFFIADGNTNGSLGFRAFKFVRTPEIDQSNDPAALTARNMGKALWERKSAGELGVRALLMAASGDEPDEASIPADIPQSGGHGARGYHVVSSPAHAVAPIRNFATTTQSPRVPFATPFRSVDVLHPTPPLANEPAMSPTRHLFQATPFPVQPLAHTRFAANVPHYASKPLKAPKGRKKAAALAAAAAAAAAQGAT